MYEALYIDDQLDSIEIFSDAFQEHDIQVTGVTTPKDMIYALKRKRFDALLVDLHMPKHNGIAVIKMLKEKYLHKDLPIFILSTDDCRTSLLSGLQVGIRDYLTKLMNTDEMAIRIKNGINANSTESQVIKIGNLYVDQQNFQIKIDDNDIDLTFTEYRALLKLIHHYPEKVPIEDLKNFTWPNSKIITDNTMRVHIHNLRQKILNWNHQITGKMRQGIFIAKK